VIGRLYVWQGAVWLLLVRGEPFDRGPRRNVLLERVEPGFRLTVPGPRIDTARLHVAPDRSAWTLTGERVVRPFRGLRRYVAIPDTPRPQGPDPCPTT
jgi:hypothetical protein